MTTLKQMFETLYSLRKERIPSRRRTRTPEDAQADKIKKAESTRKTKRRKRVERQKAITRKRQH